MNTIVADLGGLAVLVLFGVSVHAADARQSWQHQRYDTNQDGKVDDAELAKARDIYVSRVGPRDGKSFPPSVQARLLAEFDANRNGKLDDDEARTAHYAFTERRMQRTRQRSSRTAPP